MCITKALCLVFIDHTPEAASHLFYKQLLWANSIFVHMQHVVTKGMWVKDTQANTHKYEYWNTLQHNTGKYPAISIIS